MSNWCHWQLPRQTIEFSSWHPEIQSSQVLLRLQIIWYYIIIHNNAFNCRECSFSFLGKQACIRFREVWRGLEKFREVKRSWGLQLHFENTDDLDDIWWYRKIWAGFALFFLLDCILVVRQLDPQQTTSEQVEKSNRWYYTKYTQYLTQYLSIIDSMLNSPELKAINTLWNLKTRQCHFRKFRTSIRTSLSLPKLEGGRGMLQGFVAVLSVWWSGSSWNMLEYVGISSLESFSDRNGWLIGRWCCGFQSDSSLEATQGRRGSVRRVLHLPGLLTNKSCVRQWVKHYLNVLRMFWASQTAAFQQCSSTILCSNRHPLLSRPVSGPLQWGSGQSSYSRYNHLIEGHCFRIATHCLLSCV